MFISSLLWKGLGEGVGDPSPDCCTGALGTVYVRVYVCLVLRDKCSVVLGFPKIKNVTT